MTVDIREFLKARLDEAGQHARKDLHALDAATARGDWQVRYGVNLPATEVRAGGALIGTLTATLGSLADGAEDLHARDGFLVARMVRTARHRAQQALRDVEAKRRIVTMYDHKNGFSDIAAPWHNCSDQHVGMAIEHVYAVLALPYDTHPDYDESWRP